MNFGRQSAKVPGMKTKRAIELAGGTTKALAELFQITPGAISQWGEDLPRGRMYELRVLKPDWFADQPPPRSGEQEPAAPEAG